MSQAIQELKKLGNNEIVKEYEKNIAFEQRANQLVDEIKNTLKTNDVTKRVAGKDLIELRQICA